MKKSLESRYSRISMLLAFFALSVLLVPSAFAQSRQDFTHGKRLVPPTCRGNQLSLRHDPEDAAMGGVRAMQFFLSNTSSAPCTLKGYPRFELLDRYGRLARRGQAANGLTRMGDDLQQPPQLVTIEPGKGATFWIGYLARGAGAMGKPCPTYRRFRITVPGTRRVFLQRDVIEVCSGLEISPVRAPSGE